MTATLRTASTVPGPSRSQGTCSPSPLTPPGATLSHHPPPTTTLDSFHGLRLHTLPGTHPPWYSRRNDEDRVKLSKHGAKCFKEASLPRTPFDSSERVRIPHRSAASEACVVWLTVVRGTLCISRSLSRFLSHTRSLAHSLSQAGKVVDAARLLYSAGRLKDALRVLADAREYEQGAPVTIATRPPPASPTVLLP